MFISLTAPHTCRSEQRDRQELMVISARMNAIAAASLPINSLFLASSHRQTMPADSVFDRVSL